MISETVFKYKTDVFLFYKLGSDTLLRRPASQYALHTCQMMLLVKIIQSDKLIINIITNRVLGICIGRHASRVRTRICHRVTTFLSPETAPCANNAEKTRKKKKKKKKGPNLETITNMLGKELTFVLVAVHVQLSIPQEASSPHQQNQAAPFSTLPSSCRMLLFDAKAAPCTSTFS